MVLLAVQHQDHMTCVYPVCWNMLEYVGMSCIMICAWTLSHAFNVCLCFVSRFVWGGKDVVAFATAFVSFVLRHFDTVSLVVCFTLASSRQMPPLAVVFKLKR